jgi:DNA polymerase-3 subunit alpha
MSKFVHLHNHTHYSVLDSIVKVQQLVDYAVNDNQDAIALTDHGVMFGVMEFYIQCKKKNIKPIIGCEMYVATGSRFNQEKKIKQYHHLLLLAKDQQGYKNLMKLSSLGHTEGFYYRPRIDKELLEKYHEGLICTSACLGGIIPQHIVNERFSEAETETQYYKNLFKDDFYIELQRHNYKEDELVIKHLKAIADKFSIPMVATNDIHYLNKEDAIAHNVYLLIKDSAGKEQFDIEDLRYLTDEFYFRTQEQMIELFSDIPSAISNTIEVAEKCNLEIDITTFYMPTYQLPANSKFDSTQDFLQNLVYDGLKLRYDEITDEIKERADYELKVLNDLKFTDYFLLVYEIVEAARNLNVRIGPGRGSAAGSIVAYALRITNVDPIKYNLLFERFLNPSRVSIPDIDLDFCDLDRIRLID